LTPVPFFKEAVVAQLQDSGLIILRSRVRIPPLARAESLGPVRERGYIKNIVSIVAIEINVHIYVIGASTLSIMTFSTTKFSIMTFSIIVH